jgi:hypothetical protein
MCIINKYIYIYLYIYIINAERGKRKDAIEDIFIFFIAIKHDEATITGYLWCSAGIVKLVIGIKWNSPEEPRVASGSTPNPARHHHICPK